MIYPRTRLRLLLLGSVSLLLATPVAVAAPSALTALERAYIGAEDAKGADKISQWKALLAKDALQGDTLLGVSRAKVQLNLVDALMEEANARKDPALLQEAITTLVPLKKSQPQHYVWSLVAIARTQVTLGATSAALETLKQAQQSVGLLRERSLASRAIAGVALTQLMLLDAKPVFGMEGYEAAGALMDSIIGAQQYAEVSEARALVYFTLKQPDFIRRMPVIVNSRDPKEIKKREDYIEAAARRSLKAGAWEEALRTAQAMPLSRSGRRAALLVEIHKQALKAGETELALTALRSIARANEQGVPIYDYARSLIAQKNYTEVERVARLIEDPRHASVTWATLAKEYYNLDKKAQVDAALAEAEKAALRETKDPSRRAEALGRLVRVAAETERFVLAERILAQTPEDRRGEGQAALTKKYAERDRVDEAIALYKTMPQDVPGGRDLRALAAIIKALADDRRLDEAEQWMQTPGTEDTLFDRARVAMIKAYLKQKNISAAQKLLPRIKDTKLRKEAEELFAQQHGALAAGASPVGLRITTKKEADAYLASLPAQSLEQGQSDTAIALVRAGNIADAVTYAKAIKNGKKRALTFRALAELQAAQTDYFDKLPASKFGQPDAKEKITLPQLTPEKPTASERARFDKETTRLAAQESTAPIIRRPLHSSFGTVIPDIAHKERLTYDTDFVKKRLPSKMTDVKAGLMSYELCLYNIKLVYANGHEDFAHRQQTASPQVVYVEEGVTNLPTLYDLLQKQGAGDTLTREGNVYTLRKPLVIGPKASLVIEGSQVEDLRMSEERGAYIVNAGKLYIVDTHITAWREAAQAPAYSDYASSKNFRPFIMTWSASEAYFAGSVFTALGYSNSKSYGITISAGPERMLRFRHEKIKRPTAIIVDNSFDNAYYGFYCYEAEDVTLVGNEYVNNIIYGIDPHDYSERLTIGYNTAYGSQKKHGIIISREVNNSTLIGNLSFENYGSGLMVERMSVGTLVYANTAFNNVQDGLTVYESNCSINASNHFFANQRMGINVRNSVDLGVFYNYVEDNAKAGLHGYTLYLRDEPKHQTRDFTLDPYSDLVAFSAVGNVLKANGNGVQADSMASLYLRANRFVAQSPHLFKGDWSQHFPTVLAQHDIEKDGVLMTRRCSVAHEYLKKQCSFRDQGYFDGDGQEDIVERMQANPCPAPQQTTQPKEKS